MDLSDRWPLPDSPGLRDELAAAYADPSRGYHDTRHLTEVLDRLDELAATGRRTTPRRCCWPRGSTTRSTTASATPRSARRPGPRTPWRRGARRRSRPRWSGWSGSPRRTRPTTATQRLRAVATPTSAILAAPAGRYDEYVAAVRREYAHLADDVFSAGRADVLKALAAKPQLFHTAYAREKWEQPARANLERELASLGVVRCPSGRPADILCIGADRGVGAG